MFFALFSINLLFYMLGVCLHFRQKATQKRHFVLFLFLYTTKCLYFFLVSNLFYP